MRAACFGSWLLTLCLSSLALAQLTAPQQGLHYYAVENLDTGAVQRGVAGSNGIAFGRLIMAPRTRYRISILQASTLQIGFVQLTTPDNGAQFALPQIFVTLSQSADSDFDQLPDDAEFTMGTSPSNPDTDGDGLEDGPEVKQGLNPLDGLIVQTGIIGTADTPGTAIDICTVNDISIVADSDRGISVFNVFNGMSPTIIAQVDTPGTATAVACSGKRVAVADGTAGLAIVDISDPPAARIVHQVNLGSSARAVAVAGTIAFVGLASGQVVSVDLQSGTVLETLTVANGQVQDVHIAGDYLYVLFVGTLYTLPLREGPLQIVNSRSSPGNIGAGGRRLRLFGGTDILYATHTQGYNTFDIGANPAQPALILNGTTPQFGWKHFVDNGSGLGLAAVGMNSTNDGQHNVSLYDVLDPAQIVFLTEFATPGIAAAVSIFNGLAYVADSAAGMQVVNYKGADVNRVPPTIALTTNFAAGVAEEGKLMRLTARVADDVQARNVEFYVDSEKVFTDGGFPFEHRFITPLIADQPSFTIRARAFDTGGNATWSDEAIVTLTPDATAPRLLTFTPNNAAQLTGVRSVAAFFSEPIDVASLIAGFTLVEAGPDLNFDTPDDAAVVGTIEFRDDVLGAFLNFASDLPRGLYRARIDAQVADQAGNSVENPNSWTFTVLSSTTVVGIVELENGARAGGVAVAVRGAGNAVLGSALSGIDGTFSVSAVRVTPGLTLTVTALLVEQTGPLFGLVTGIVPVADGVTDAGVITLMPGGVGGPIILGGDDLTDHGSVSGGVPQDGWLYIQRAIENLHPQAFRFGNDGTIAALGAGPSGSTCCDAGAAIGFAAATAGYTVNYVNGAAQLQTFFADLASGAVNPAILWVSGTGASNNLDFSEGQVLTNNAAAIADFVNSGGGLMAHGSGSTAYGWLSALLPGLMEVSSGSSGDLELTPAGLAAFPGVTNTNVNAGPWHSYFQGDLGGLEVLVKSNNINDNAGNDAAVVVGGSLVILPGGAP